MICGNTCIHRLGLVCKVEGHINQHCYHEILEQNVCRMIQDNHLDLSYIIFQENNAPLHIAKLLQEWFSRQCFIVNLG